MLWDLWHHAKVLGHDLKVLGHDIMLLWHDVNPDGGGPIWCWLRVNMEFVEGQYEIQIGGG